jgi:hypothetical protein
VLAGLGLRNDDPSFGNKARTLSGPTEETVMLKVIRGRSFY